MSGFSITENKGFQIHFESGWTASVQFGRYNDCANNSLGINKKVEPKCVDAEIAAFPTAGGEWLELDNGDVVKGYCKPAEVLAFLNKVASLEEVS